MTASAASAVTEVLSDLEVEMSLLSRHQIHSSQHAPDRVLDRSGYALLSRLEHGPMSLKQLSEAFNLDQSTVNRQINALRKRGLVERVADPDGGVALLIRPTRKGRAQLARDREVSRGQIGRVLADWDSDDVAEFGRLLRAFNNSIEHLEGRPWPR